MNDFPNEKSGKPQYCTVDVKFCSWLNQIFISHIHSHTYDV